MWVARIRREKDKWKFVNGVKSCSGGGKQTPLHIHSKVPIREDLWQSQEQILKVQSLFPLLKAKR